MAKKETSKKRKKSETAYLREHVPFTSDVLKDSQVVTEVLLECIRTGDVRSFREVLAAHLLTVNKTRLAARAGISRRTIYDLIDFKKDFNPELSTISSLLKALAA